MKKIEKNLKTVNKIQEIALITKAKFERNKRNNEYTNFLVVEDQEGLSLLYDLKTMKDHSFDLDKRLALFQGKSQIEVLYRINDNDYHTPIDIGYMDSINKYTNYNLKNNLTNEKVLSNYLLFQDENLQKIIIDLCHNHLFLKGNNYSLEEDKKSKVEVLYQRNTN